MKIIKNNYNNLKNKEENIEFKCTCPNCKSILEVYENDIKYDTADEECIICPCCHNIITSEYFDRVVTIDNIFYPFDFYKIGESDKTVHLNNQEINKYIKECIDFFKKYPDEPYRYIGTGDSLIIVFNQEDEYTFIVAKNYEESFINKS